MQPQNPLDPQAPQQPLPPNQPVNPVPPAQVPQPPVDPLAQPGQPAQQYGAPAPAAPAEPIAQQPMQPAPFTPTDPMAPQQAPQQPAPTGTPMGTPAPMAPAPAGPEAPKSNFFANLNKKLLIKIGIIVGIVVLVVAGILIGARFLPSNPVTNFLTGVQGVTLEDYTNEEMSLSIKTPKGWVVDEDTDSTFVKSVNFKEPTAELDDKSLAGKNRASISIVMSDYSSSEYLKTEESKYFDRAKESIKAGLDARADNEDSKTKYDVVSEDTVEINGNKAYKVKIKVSNFGEKENETGYLYQVYIFVDENHQYTISAAAHEADKGPLDAFESIINSFKSTKK